MLEIYYVEIVQDKFTFVSTEPSPTRGPVQKYYISWTVQCTDGGRSRQTRKKIACSQNAVAAEALLT